MKDDRLEAALRTYYGSADTDDAFRDRSADELDDLRVALDFLLSTMSSEVEAAGWLRAVLGEEVFRRPTDGVADPLEEPLGGLHGLSIDLAERAGRPAWFTASLWGGMGVDNELNRRLSAECRRQASAFRADSAWADWWVSVAPVAECHVVLGLCTAEADNSFFEEGVFRKRRLLLVVRQVSADDYERLDNEGQEVALAEALLSCIDVAAAKFKASQPRPPAPRGLPESP